MEKGLKSRSSGKPRQKIQTEMEAELPRNKPSPVTGRGGERKCAFKYEDGLQCAARPLSDSDYCFFHDPRDEVAQKRLEGRRMGGKRRVWKGLGNNKCRDIRDFESLRELLNEAANAIILGRMDAKIGNCLASISSVMYRVIETKNIEGRLDEIERKMKELEQSRKSNKS
jgi:hypothetical protein